MFRDSEEQKSEEKMVNCPPEIEDNKIYEIRTSCICRELGCNVILRMTGAHLRLVKARFEREERLKQAIEVAKRQRKYQVMRNPPRNRVPNLQMHPPIDYLVDYADDV